MEVINESLYFENKDMLPEILMRIFSVCKADPHFPLKSRIDEAEEKVDSLNAKIERQKVLVDKTIKMRDDLSNRLQTLRQENFELKSRLLEELGSEL
jgi:septal ring factor EnvC (AmiA/AmiB activator)